MENQKQNIVNDDEISLKDVIIKLKSYASEIFRNWKILVLFLLLSCAYFTYSALQDDIKYKAELSFMVNEDESQSVSGAVGGILGQFGLMTSNSSYNLDKILDLFTTRKIVERVLFKREAIEGKEDYIINHLIESFEEKGEWRAIKFYEWPFVDREEEQRKREYRFDKDSLHVTNTFENRIFRSVYRRVVGDPDNGISGMFGSDYSDKTGIMDISIRSYNEDLSIAITNHLFDELSKFYIEKSIEKQQATFDIVKIKSDSIQNALNNAEYGLAQFKDTNRGLYSKKDQLSESRLKRKVAILSTALAKALENKEIADFTLQSKTPFIQVIDRPISPTVTIKKSLFKNLQYGIVLGLMAGIIFIILRLLYRELMQ